VGSNRLKALVEETASLSFVISAFAFGGLMAAAHPLLRILWEGEKFTGGAITDVYKTLTIISICLFFNALAIIFRKISMTLGKVKEMYLGYIGVQILSFVALLFLKNIISLELVLSVLLLNTIILAFVPIVLVKRTSSIDVPINLGEKTGRNVVYFILLSGFGAMLEWSTLHFGIFQNAFVAFGFSVAVFLLLSVLAAFVLGLNELRFLKSIQSRIAARF
jgi:peptidoglycan biosynthesis protein MviN/MurJ (putative lipid II flippase)